MTGHARDVFTPLSGGTPQILDEGRYTITASPIREIMAIEATPTLPEIQQMVGIRGGGASRIALARILGHIEGTALYQIMDDFAGASLVSAWLWSIWTDDFDRLTAQVSGTISAGRGGQMLNVCTGFAEGSSALAADGGPDNMGRNQTIVGSLVNPADPEGWHHLPEQSGPKFRRARRIDIWREDGLIRVECGFQDSGSNPAGGRTAVHEYRLSAAINAADMRLVSLDPEAHILPYRECPGAIANVQRLIGRPVSALRTDVLQSLPNIMGCTHLNDVLRALADVPFLAKALP
jgi:Protein of unknown function (DUF2889)